MQRSQKWQALALVMAVSSATVMRAADYPTQEEATFTVHVQNYARVDLKTLAETERVVSTIFHKAGVAIRWVDFPVTSNGSSVDLTDGESDGLSDLCVFILPQEMSDRLGMPDNVMGLAPGTGPDRRLVYVFYKGLRALAQRQVSEKTRGNIPGPASLVQILGAMMAHELGHVLLNLPAHSETGIMRGDWDLKDLCDLAHGSLLFTRQQAEVIRADVARRSHQQHRLAEIADRTPQ